MHVGQLFTCFIFFNYCSVGGIDASSLSMAAAMNNAGINLMRRRKQRTSFCRGVVAFLDYVMPCHQHHLHRVRHTNNYYTAAAATTTIRNVATTKNEAVDSNSNLNDRTSTIKKVAIIGGGLAGLSTAYHLLLHNTLNNNKEGGIHITIYDTAKVGEGGASSVAGGLLHPFSPRGKLIHYGLCALDATNYLIQAAIKYEPNCIIKSQLYRLAFDDSNSWYQLQETANQYPTLATWLTEENMSVILPPLVDIPDTATTTTSSTTSSTAATSTSTAAAAAVGRWDSNE
jgi:hypothetical protein